MSEFVHLHTHSDYSLLEGMMRISEAYKQADAYNMSAVALTDSGNLFGALEFYTHGKQKHPNIKPIIGCEVLLTDDIHQTTAANVYELVLLAKNNIGYHNLMLLLSYSTINATTNLSSNGLSKKNIHSYSNNKTVIPFSYLEQHKDDLIVLSSGRRGKIATLLAKNKEQEAQKVVDDYSHLFGKENFYLEIQDHNYAEEKKLNQQIIALAQKHDVSLVATNNVYYTYHADQKAHEILLCIQYKITLEQYRKMSKDDKKNLFTLPGSDYHFKTAEEMERLFSNHPEAISNTLKIAEMCDINLDKDQVHFPLFHVPEGESEISHLQKEAKRRLIEKKSAPLTEEYQKRLGYELQVIAKMGFASYFLIVADFIDEARSQKILVGPGRGSAAGSLVSYAMGITALDPIEHHLLFERFLNPERTNLPDVDIDFQDNRRNDIIDYCRKKYGANQVAQIITYGKLKAKAVFKDVARVFSLDFASANTFSKLIDDAQKEHSVFTLKEIYEKDNTLREAILSESVIQDIYQYSLRLEGLNRQTGIHAAGVIIADKNLSEYIPLVADEDGNVITQFESHLLEEYCGLIKMDFLGLKTLTILSDCVDRINKRHATHVDIENLPTDDAKTYGILSQGKIVGIFQFDKMGKQLKALKPDCLEDLTALNALNRPGASAWIPVYTAKKRNQELIFDKADTEHNFNILSKLTNQNQDLKNILASTNYVPIYQEQIMEIGKLYAGFSLGKADIMRRSIGKKKADELASVKKDFIEGAVKQGNQQQEAEFLFEKIITPFQNYGFNKSHAVCYAYIAYQMAYLKANYTIEFMVSLLNADIRDTKKIKIYIEEAYSFNIKVAPPDINASDVKFKISENNSIIYALSAIKGIGINTASIIVNNRATSPYRSLSDFFKKHDHNSQKINTQVIESLIKSGAFAKLDVSTSKALKNYPKIIKKIESEAELKSGGQLILFAGDEKSTTQTTDSNDMDKLLYEENQNSNSSTDNNQLPNLIAYEEEVLGFSMRYNLIMQHREMLVAKTNFDVNNKEKWTHQQKVTLCGLLEKIHIIKTKNDADMAFLKINNGSGKIEAVLFPNDYKKINETSKDVLNLNQFVEIYGSLQIDKLKKRDSLIVKQIKCLVIENNSHQKHPYQQQITSIEDKPSNKTYCYIKFKAHLQREDALKLKAMLESEKPGDVQIVFLFSSNERVIPKDTLAIDYSDKLKQKLMEVNYIDDVYAANA